MHIVHGELRKAPYIKSGCGQDGQSTMFIIELSEMIKDRQTGEKLYTNYSAAIFAKSQAQIDYYNTSLVEGNYVVVNCEKLKVKASDCKQYIKLEMDNAKLEGAKYIQAPAQGGFHQGQQQGSYQQQAPAQGGFQQQAPALQQGGFQQQQWTPTHGGQQAQPGKC